MGAYLNGVFPPSAPGASGSWELEDPMPGVTFKSPVRLIDIPGSDELMLLTKGGEVWRVSLEAQTKTLLLDISERVFNRGDAGAVGIALHPRFGDPAAPDKQLLFLYYRTKPNIEEWSELGFNRLSKFTWDAASGRFDPGSEEILIQQYDRSTWHNGGAMFFGPDGFFYLSLGDEGDPDHIAASTQQLSGGLFSGIIRIDVDNDPQRSHPIRRQHRANAAPPAGWGETFSQGYRIPNDNPWLSPDGDILEEFYAIGARSPYAMTLDPETGLIWIGDVGDGKREEISRVEAGDNLQWPYLEGSRPSEVHQKPDSLIGREKPVYLDYDRTVGACVIGGDVYRNTVFPELNGKYLFADYNRDKLMALASTGSQSEPEIEVLLADIGGQPVDLPEGEGITGVFALDNGEVFLTVLGEDGPNPGKIFRLKRRTDVPEPPAKLSELGAFLDLETLTPAPGIIPYRVNSPLWSDRAAKQRWLALPNDGDFDTPAEKITFESTREWTFPPGTVFIKHFELPVDMENESETVRLETRFFIIGAGGQGYGLTYQWNAEGTEAFLLGGGASRDFEIYENGQPLYTQTWDYPSRDQCMSCHNANARYVLGVKTHQLNGALYYPELGREMNQLTYLNEIGAFHRDIGQVEGYLRAHPIDDASVDLEVRVRSYLDANCASCHRLGGVPNISLDLRYTTPLWLQNAINLPTQSHSSDPNGLIVKPGYHASSELWIRDASTEDDRMPPLGRNLVDEYYIDALAEWIDGLTNDAGAFQDIAVFPNPSTGAFSLRISDQWEAPFRIRVFGSAGRVLREEVRESRSVFLDLSDQPGGVYMLEIEAGGRRQMKRLVVQ